MNFAALFETWRSVDGAHQWTAPEGWGQGRALFGGLVAAAGASLSATLTTRPLRTLQAQLLGPIAPGEVTGHAKILREGRSTTFVEVRLSQAGEERAVLGLIHIAPRPATVRIAGPSAPTWKTSAEELAPLPFIPGVTPDFTRELDMRFATGALPFSGARSAHFGGYAAFREDESDFGPLHQLALLDAWPVPTLALLRRPAPASTVTWTAHLLAPSAVGFHQFEYKTLAAGDGFSTATGQLWDASGQLVGYTEQLVAVFD